MKKKIKKQKLIKDKKFHKEKIGICQICGLEDIDTLHNHRIIYGESGGRYTENNVACCCANCHQKIHKDKIIVKGWYPSTNGRVLLVEENGVEGFRQF